jgi:hypothetical protein
LNLIPDENPEGELLRDDGAALGVLGDRQREPIGGDAYDPGNDGSPQDLTQKRIVRKGLRVLKIFNMLYHRDGQTFLLAGQFLTDN